MVFKCHRDHFLVQMWDQFVHISFFCLLFNCHSHCHFMMCMIIKYFDHKLVDCMLVMLVMFMFRTHHYKINMPPNYLRNPNVGPRVKQRKKKNQGMLFNSLHFKGKRACLSFGMGLGRIHKQELKMKSTCKTKERRRLMHIECKWYGRLSDDNFKHKFHMAYNLWEEAPLLSL